jgi:hypothetical protein
MPSPGRASDLDKLVKLLPDDAQEDPEALPDAQTALQRDEYYRAIIRYWRIGHIVLALVTLGLLLWHLEYAATLLLPLLFN